MDEHGERSMIKARKALGIFLLAASVVGAQAQSDAGQQAAQQPKPKHKTQAQLEQDLQDLSEKYERLEREMAEMKAEAERREAELEAANKAAAAAAQAEAARTAEEEKEREESVTEAVTKQGQSVDVLQGAVADLKKNSESQIDTIQSDLKRAETPNRIPFMGIGLRPGGFLAGETVDRQHGTGSDVNTPFSSIPFSGQTAGQLSEFNASGRQSRISLLAEGNLSRSTLRGYYEGDFLSAGITSNDNQSNSYTFRQRQAWGQAALNSGWTLTAGQMWSLATEYKSGLTNLQEQIPLTIDSQYQVGFTWERQYGFRVVKNLHNRIWAGVAVEEAQTLNLGGHNLPALVYQEAGTTGGLYNSSANYSFNYIPDLIAKIAIEPGIGHFEVFSVGRMFRVRAYPNGTPMLETTPWGPASPSTVGAFTTKTGGGGLGANAHIPLFWNKFELGAHGLAGNGLGRYSTTTLPDATAHPDGTLELLAGGSALGSLEWHALSRLDMYAYYGGEYVKRAFYPTGYFVTQTPTTPFQPPLGQPIVGGYGAPTNIVFGCNIEVLPSTANGVDVPGSANGCVADNRNIQEGTLGEWYRFYKGPKGTFQMGLQYSYVVRHTWQGVGLAANPVTGVGAFPGSPKAIDNMYFTSFRYYLPQ
jgi:hypothetical protein